MLSAASANASTTSALKGYSVSVVIPSYNDETTVGRLVTDTNTLFSNSGIDYEIICTNDGSFDNTLSVLRSLQTSIPCLHIINHEENEGYGQTIKELYLSGTRDLVASLPGDYQYAPKELLKMATVINDHDIVIGLRIQRNDPLRRKLQSVVYNLLLRSLYGIKHKDMNSIKLFKRKILDQVQLKSLTPFVDAELCIRAEHSGFKIIELPIEHLPRTAGGASGGKLSVIFETIFDLIKMRPTL